MTSRLAELQARLTKLQEELALEEQRYARHEASASDVVRAERQEAQARQQLAQLQPTASWGALPWLGSAAAGAVGAWQTAEHVRAVYEHALTQRCPAVFRGTWEELVDFYNKLTKPENWVPYVTHANMERALNVQKGDDKMTVTARPNYRGDDGIVNVFFTRLGKRLEMWLPDPVSPDPTFQWFIEGPAPRA